jgi:hypothetical protein
LYQGGFSPAENHHVPRALAAEQRVQGAGIYSHLKKLQVRGREPRWTSHSYRFHKGHPAVLFAGPYFDAFMATAFRKRTSQ